MRLSSAWEAAKVHERLSPRLVERRRSCRLRICFHEDRGSGKHVERNKDEVDIL